MNKAFKMITYVFVLLSLCIVIETVFAAHLETWKNIIPPILTRALFWRAISSQSLPGDCVSLRGWMGPRKTSKVNSDPPLGDEVLISIFRVPLWE